MFQDVSSGDGWDRKGPHPGRSWLSQGNGADGVQVQSTEEGHGVEGCSGHVTHKETVPGEDTPRPIGMECSRGRSEIFIPGSVWQRQPDQASQGTHLSAAWLKQCLGCGLGLGVGSEVPLKAEVLTTTLQPQAQDVLGEDKL